MSQVQRAAWAIREQQRKEQPLQRVVINQSASRLAQGLWDRCRARGQRVQMIQIDPAAISPLKLKVMLQDSTVEERETVALPFIPDHADVGISMARSAKADLAIIVVVEGESIDPGNGLQLTALLSPEGRTEAQLVDELLALSDLAQAHGRQVLWVEVRWS